MEKLIEILEEIEPGVDYENCTTLIDDNYLDSLAIISLVISSLYNTSTPSDPLI